MGDAAYGMVTLEKTVVAWAADEHAGWIATDAAQYGYCGIEECANAPPGAIHHVTMVFDGDDPLAWHDALPVSDKDQAKALAHGVELAAMATNIEPGALDAVAVFKATIRDPKKLANSVSPRKDVVLYGSAQSERYVGGAAVKKQLTRWNLVFSLRDGVRAGVSSGGTVALVAAKLDADGAWRGRAAGYSR